MNAWLAPETRSHHSTITSNSLARRGSWRPANCQEIWEWNASNIRKMKTKNYDDGRRRVRVKLSDRIRTRRTQGTLAAPGDSPRRPPAAHQPFPPRGSGRGTRCRENAGRRALQWEAPLWRHPNHWCKGQTINEAPGVTVVRSCIGRGRFSKAIRANGERSEWPLGQGEGAA